MTAETPQRTPSLRSPAMANVPGQSPAARARSKRSRHLVRVLSPNPRFSAGRSEGARHIPSRADQGCRVAVRRTSTAAHVEPGERGAAGQGPPRRRSRDSESSPAPVALREGKELINRMPQQRGWATSLEVAAGITNSLIDSYPFRPPPTHSESVEQKQLLAAAWRETPGFPPLAETLTAQPCQSGGGKGIVNTGTVEGRYRTWEGDNAGTANSSCVSAFTAVAVPMK